MEIEHRSCAGCKFWHPSENADGEGECRVNSPAVGAKNNWPVTADTAWCSRFMAAGSVHRGTQPKVSDTAIIEIVWEMSRPDSSAPRSAYRRAELVTELIEMGMSRTAATKRVEKLVKHGVFKQGDNPWLREYETPGIYVWMEKAATAAGPTDALLDALLKSRLTLRGLAKASGVPITTTHRHLRELVAAGRVKQCDDGMFMAMPQAGGAPEESPE